MGKLLSIPAVLGDRLRGRPDAPQADGGVRAVGGQMGGARALRWGQENVPIPERVR